MPTPRSGRRPGTTALLLGLAAGLAMTAGCGAPTTTRSVINQPAASVGAAGTGNPVPAASTPLPALPLPFDDYVFSPRQRDAYEAAVWVLVGRCLTGFGLAAPPARVSPHLDDQDVDYDAGRSRRYGVQDPAEVAVRGYHPPPQQKTGVDVALPADDQWLLALTGGSPPQAWGAPRPSTPTHRSINGQPVPPGGCRTAAESALAGDDTTVGYAALPRTVQLASYQESTQQPAVTAAFRNWSDCMRALGFGYADPLAANNDSRWQTVEATAAEIATATADVACKEQTGLVAIWHDAEVSLQRASFAGHDAELTELRRHNDEVMTRARAVLGTAS
ncbi:MAG: hypothetical protein EPO13_10205 [Actinomycetota bacterium]|nr:MAG: hypothetical protein EPO13_10205 [Actinomycetota bacterium]